ASLVPRSTAPRPGRFHMRNSRIAAVLGVAALWAAVPSSADAQATPPAPSNSVKYSAADFAGDWVGVLMWDPRIPMLMDITLTAGAGDAVTGGVRVAPVKPMESRYMSEGSGSFTVEGTFNPGSEMLELLHGPWIDQRGPLGNPPGMAAVLTSEKTVIAGV